MDVRGGVVSIVALAGIVVNLAVLALLSSARRDSLNIRGAYLHIATDLAAFAGTAVAGGLILLTGWDRFDPVASLLVAGLMFLASYTLLKESGRIFLEAAPESAPPAHVGRAIAGHPGVVEVHDLHVWTVTSGFPALSAHVLVEPGADCHRIRLELESQSASGSDSTTRPCRWSTSACRAASRSHAGPAWTSVDAKFAPCGTFASGLESNLSKSTPFWTSVNVGWPHRFGS
jgi:cation diffusion facilitator family transporter